MNRTLGRPVGLDVGGRTRGVVPPPATDEAVESIRPRPPFPLGPPSLVDVGAIGLRVDRLGTVATADVASRAPTMIGPSEESRP